MTRRSKEDCFARVRELYTFDEQIRSSVASGLVPDVEGLVPNGRRPSSKDSTAEDAKNAEGFCNGKISLSDLGDLCGEEKRRLSLAGFDEAGRGALAGPVAVGCVHFDLPLQQPSYTRYDATKGIPVASGLVPDVVFPKHLLEHLAGVDDSKRLSPARREEMYHRITEVASWGIGWASAQEIDLLGIVSAISLAARRAYITMGERVDLLLCDRGLSLLSDLAIDSLNHLQPRTPNHPISQSSDHSIIQSLELSFTKGDSRSLHIAAASILAKVSRDRMMLNLHQRFPVYAFAANKGYGTPAHLAALRDNGPSAIHRRSFRVKE